MTDAGERPFDDLACWLVECDFDPDRSRDLGTLRASHLEHVDAHRARIEFGGLVGPSDAPTGILYVLRVDDEEASRAFVAADPYRAVYSTVRIVPVTKRLPIAESRATR